MLASINTNVLLWSYTVIKYSDLANSRVKHGFMEFGKTIDCYKYSPKYVQTKSFFEKCNFHHTIFDNILNIYFVTQ